MSKRNRKGRKSSRAGGGAPNDLTHVFKPLGFCMYCGAKGTDLGREHIVPLALRGTLILPQSSCSECSKITGKFEGICANKNFGTWRRHLKMRSGRRPEPTDFIRIEVETPDGDKVERYVSIQDYPKFLVLPSFPEPAILTGNIVAPLTYNFHWRTQQESELKKIAERVGGKSIIQHEFDMLAFTRMIAKIGYSLTVAEVGRENFEPFSLDFILGKQPQVIGGVVGQSRWVPNGIKRGLAPTHYAHLRLIPFWGDMFFLGAVHFFCKDTPLIYSTVVGRLAANPTDQFWNWKGLKPLLPQELEALRARYYKTHNPLLGDSPKERLPS